MVWIIVKEGTWHKVLRQNIYRDTVHAAYVHGVHKSLFWHPEFLGKGNDLFETVGEFLIANEPVKPGYLIIPAFKIRY